MVGRKAAGRELHGSERLEALERVGYVDAVEVDGLPAGFTFGCGQDLACCGSHCPARALLQVPLGDGPLQEVEETCTRGRRCEVRVRHGPSFRWDDRIIQHVRTQYASNVLISNVVRSLSEKTVGAHAAPTTMQAGMMDRVESDIA